MKNSIMYIRKLNVLDKFLIILGIKTSNYKEYASDMQHALSMEQISRASRSIKQHSEDEGPEFDGAGFTELDNYIF